MTPLMQSLGMAFSQVSTHSAAGRQNNLQDRDFAVALEDSQEAFASLLEGLGIPLESVTPEMLATLQQWLASGSDLPLAASDGQLPMAGGGNGLPLLDHLTQAVRQLRGGGNEEVDPRSWLNAMKQDLTGNVNPSTQAGGAAQLLPSGEAVVKELVRSLAEAGGLQQSGGQTDTGAAGQESLLRGLMQPTQAQGFTRVLTDNLLAMGMPQRVTDPNWGQALGERLVWMVKGDQQMAELKITPPNLGTLEVKLTINHDQASVSFVSNHAAVRDALEAAIPRLREMLGQESLNLANVDVGSGQREQAQGGADAQRNGAGSGWGGEATADTDDATPGQSMGLVDARGLGLIDLFA